MPSINEVFNEFLKNVIKAQDESNRYSAKLVGEYQSDAILSNMFTAVPHARIDSAEIQFKYVVNPYHLPLTESSLASHSVEFSDLPEKVTSEEILNMAARHVSRMVCKYFPIYVCFFNEVNKQNNKLLPQDTNKIQPSDITELNQKILLQPKTFWDMIEEMGNEESFGKVIVKFLADEEGDSKLQFVTKLQAFSFQEPDCSEFDAKQQEIFEKLLKNQQDVEWQQVKTAWNGVISTHMGNVKDFLIELESLTSINVDSIEAIENLISHSIDQFLDTLPEITEPLPEPKILTPGPTTTEEAVTTPVDILIDSDSLKKVPEARQGQITLKINFGELPMTEIITELPNN